MKISRSGKVASAYFWTSTLIDPIRIAAFPVGVYRYVRDWRRYSKMPGAEKLRFRDSQPCFADRTSLTPFDAQYFYQAVWATRAIIEFGAAEHIDVGSQVSFVGTLSVSVPTTFVDIRPVELNIPNFTAMAGSGLALPFEDGSVQSLSCLHVAEHVGLGRYGDPLDPEGTKKMCAELQRVLAPGGQLLFSMPAGRSRVMFNAHRVHTPQQVLSYFADLKLLELSGINDDREMVNDIADDVLAQNGYGCGLYRFTKLS